jgi:hypothetical protein
MADERPPGPGPPSGHLDAEAALHALRAWGAKEGSWGTKDVDIDVVYYPGRGAAELQVLCFIKGVLQWVSKRYHVEDEDYSGYDESWLRWTAAKAKTEAAKALLAYEQAWSDHQDSDTPPPPTPVEKWDVGDWHRERTRFVAEAQRGVCGTWILRPELPCGFF